MKSTTYPHEVRLFAKGIYLQCGSYNETAKLVKKQYSQARCNAETIRRWALKEDWESSRSAVAKRITTGQEDEAVRLLEKHSELYDKIMKKGEKGLRQFEARSAVEATSMLDTGIRGQRASLKELVSLNFVKAVFQIVSEEITDEGTRRRIALRFKELGEGL